MFSIRGAAGVLSLLTSEGLLILFEAKPSAKTPFSYKIKFFNLIYQMVIRII